MLWELDAIKIRQDPPFELASGNFSPIYVNCRRAISDTAVMDFVAASFHWVMRSDDIEADVLAGGETAGIPFASFLASRLCRPMVYVRKRPKGHGTESLVEGGDVGGRTVLLVEDLITDAGSKLDFISGLRDQRALVTDCLVLFDREQGGAETLSAHGVTLHSVTSLSVALRTAVGAGIVSQDDLASVQSYLADPKGWHVARGLPFKERTDG
jgi:orotate phosphoribosyltransferase